MEHDNENPKENWNCANTQSMEILWFWIYIDVDSC